MAMLTSQGASLLVILREPDSLGIESLCHFRHNEYCLGTNEFIPHSSAIRYSPIVTELKTDPNTHISVTPVNSETHNRTDIIDTILH